MFAFALLQYWKLVFYIAKKLGLEKFITATQTTIAKNDIGFPTDANSSPSFRLMRKLAIQDGLNPLIHGAERCCRNWSDWKQKVEENSETQFHFASATASEHVGWFMIESLPIPTEHETSLLGKPPSLDWF